MKKKTLIIVLILLLGIVLFTAFKSGDQSPVKVGDKVPLFVLDDQFGNAFDMDAFLATFPAVVDPDAEPGVINAGMNEQELKQTKAELDTLKQQYKSLEGRTRNLSSLDSKYAESQRLAQEQGARILELTQMVADATNKPVEDILTPEEQKTFAKSRPIVEKIADNKAQSAVDAALESVDGKFTEQGDRISGLEKVVYRI